MQLIFYFVMLLRSSAILLQEFIHVRDLMLKEILDDWHLEPVKPGTTSKGTSQIPAGTNAVHSPVVRAFIFLIYKEIFGAK